MLRQQELCPGPSECPEVLNVDPEAGRDALPCSECPASRLDEYLASPHGRMISLVIDLDSAIQVGIDVTLKDLSYLDLLLLRILNEERGKYQVEQMKRTR